MRSAFGEPGRWPRGLFCFGTERILVSGEASGLLNLFGEGISSALASGRIAGKLSVNSIQQKVPPGRLYRQGIEAEKKDPQHLQL